MDRGLYNQKSWNSRRWFPPVQVHLFLQSTLAITKPFLDLPWRTFPSFNLFDLNFLWNIRLYKFFLILQQTHVFG